MGILGSFILKATANFQIVSLQQNTQLQPIEYSRGLSLVSDWPSLLKTSHNKVLKGKPYTYLQ